MTHSQHTLIYLHGFLSSPLSYKAQQVKDYCQQFMPQIDYICPTLTPYPDECAHQLSQLMDSLSSPAHLVGSSMGGFWATWLAERYNCKALLINPAVDVLGLIPAYLNTSLKNYHDETRYYLTLQHLEQLRTYAQVKMSNVDPHRYWLLVQQGDETLDYRLAVEKYRAYRQTIEPGGDHSFQHFERFLAPMFDFFLRPPQI